MRTQKLTAKNTTKLENSSNRYGFCFKDYRNDLVEGTVLNSKSPRNRYVC